jgi:hypothetical protein
VKLHERLKNNLRRILDPVFTQIAVSAGYRMEQNISLALQRNAVDTTAEYVLAKMGQAAVFGSGGDLLRWAARKCRDQKGMVMEFGVWKGKSLRVIANAFDQTVYGFDSFRGLPEDWRAGMPAGTFALKRPPRIPRNAELVIGWFNETLDGFLALHTDRIKFLHIDCDLYSSTRGVLSQCAEQLTAGSIILFDEYFNYPGWQEGEFRAFQEMIATHEADYRYLGYTSTHQQVAIEIIPSGLSRSPSAQA